jgi:hypothetical protein|tara:strand:- start:1637 stop:2389 length:753 start_codon:yes stop_codon:yes gene_type:complete
MKLNEEQIVENWNKLILIIESEFSGDRKANLLKMYNHFEERMSIAPASGLVHYHNCFVGGYVDHVLRVIESSLLVWESWKKMGANKSDFTKEELIFSALNHDLGKVGDEEHDYYIHNESEWHRKNQGKLYAFNPKLTHMSVPDRSLYLLNQFGIKYTAKECLAIRLHDGLYDQANEPYLKTYNPDKELKTYLPILLHHADHMASRIEHDLAANNKVDKPINKVSYGTKKKPVLTDSKKSAQDLLKGFFNE